MRTRPPTYSFGLALDQDNAVDKPGNIPVHRSTVSLDAGQMALHQRYSGAVRQGPRQLVTSFYRLFAAVSADKLVWRLDATPLRILMYHGICEDEVTQEDWVPGSFVPRSAFERQLQYLKANSRVIPLSEAVQRLRGNSLPPRSVAITFDDGYANNLHLAYPLLARYEAPATIFLSTSYLESGELFIPDRLRLIALHGYEDFTGPGNPFLQYTASPLDPVVERADRKWAEVKAKLRPFQIEALRPLRIDELSRFDTGLVEFGGHSHHHCILGNENPTRREWEIRHCIERVQTWTQKPVRLFAYPNGTRNDFGEIDKRVLRDLQICAAVSSISGTNRRGCDLLELRRYPVGLYHEDHIFAAEIAGFRSMLRLVSLSR